MRERPTDFEYDLFNHVLDEGVRNYNRANFLANLFEDHTPSDSNTVSKFGVARILKYFTNIPKEDQKKVLLHYKAIMESRGFKEVVCQ